MAALVERLLSVPSGVVYAVVALLVFAEDALFFGFVIPGETAAVIGGVAASRGHVSLALMLPLVVAAAVIGDSVGFEVGRKFGPRLLAHPRLLPHEERLGRAQGLLAERGGAAVFLGRFVAFFRAVMPALAGSARMPYRRFLTYNLVGGITWGAIFVLVGYLAGESYETVAKTIGRGSAVVVAVLALGALTWWHFRRHGRDTPEA